MTNRSSHMASFDWTNIISLEPCAGTSRHNFGRDILNPSLIG